MGALDLLNKTQKAYVNNPRVSPSELIEYTHKSGTVVSDLYVLVELGEFNDSKPDNKKVNSVTITNVVLPEIPTQVDSFLLNGLEYHVRDWSGREMYVIYAENGKRNKVSSRSFK